MFCTECGIKLPENYSYIVCDKCFDEKRQKLLYEGKERVAPRIELNVGGEWGQGFSGFSGWQGVQGFSGVSGMSGYNFNETLPKRETPPTDSSYLFSDRAQELKKKKLLRKRMIRCAIEGEEEMECPTEEELLNFKGKFIAEMEMVQKKQLVNPLNPTEEQKALFQHIQTCETCKKLWDE